MKFKFLSPVEPSRVVFRNQRKPPDNSAAEEAQRAREEAIKREADLAAERAVRQAEFKRLEAQRVADIAAQETAEHAEYVKNINQLETAIDVPIGGMPVALDSYYGLPGDVFYQVPASQKMKFEGNKPYNYMTKIPRRAGYQHPNVSRENPNGVSVGVHNLPWSSHRCPNGVIVKYYRGLPKLDGKEVDPFGIKSGEVLVFHLGRQDPNEQPPEEKPVSPAPSMTKSADTPTGAPRKMTNPFTWIRKPVDPSKPNGDTYKLMEEKVCKTLGLVDNNGKPLYKEVYGWKQDYGDKSGDSLARNFPYKDLSQKKNIDAKRKLVQIKTKPIRILKDPNDPTNLAKSTRVLIVTAEDNPDMGLPPGTAIMQLSTGTNESVTFKPPEAPKPGFNPYANNS